jgi:hypothetical protein
VKGRGLNSVPAVPWLKRQPVRYRRGTALASQAPPRGCGSLRAALWRAEWAQTQGVRIKDQKHVWGSCGPDRIVNLNWHLIFAPKTVLEYAVVHELCHLRHRNHDRSFWGGWSAHSCRIGRPGRRGWITMSISWAFRGSYRSPMSLPRRRGCRFLFDQPMGVNQLSGIAMGRTHLILLIQSGLLLSAPAALSVRKKPSQARMRRRLRRGWRSVIGCLRVWPGCTRPPLSPMPSP